ncbi:sulfotransferase [Paracoccus jeotgali]|uniref:sulfotransferase n=1 Tax=Paracoccus jeotgali TaxID=2065379 RepID=UPI0013153124|nr:sulfotransferase [Paracoccus jeotgali]
MTVEEMLGGIEENGKRIIIGLGSGRCGTMSLAKLINAQTNSVCFHELNPSGMSWCGAEYTVLSLLRDFTAIIEGEERAITADLVSPDRLSIMPRLLELQNVDVLGDVASYYLPYVELVISRAPAARFPCMRRDKKETIDSFVNKLSELPNEKPRNPWACLEDRRWRHDPIWDRCFPKTSKVNGEDLAEYIGEYYDEYYREAEIVEREHRENFRIFDTNDLNSNEGRSEILNFCLPDADHKNFHVHKNKRKSH